MKLDTFWVGCVGEDACGGSHTGERKHDSLGTLVLEETGSLSMYSRRTRQRDAQLGRVDSIVPLRTVAH